MRRVEACNTCDSGNGYIYGVSSSLTICCELNNALEPVHCANVESNNLSRFHVVGLKNQINQKS